MRAEYDRELMEDLVTAVREVFLGNWLVVGITDHELFARLQVDAQQTLKKALDFETMRMLRPAGS